MSEREYLLPQKKFVEVIKTLAKEYDIEVIDLYNSNILDSHDANVIAEYMPDGVHGNPTGYQVLAEHFAGEIVKYYNEDSDIADSSMVSSRSVSGNQTDSDRLSGNGADDTELQDNTDRPSGNRWEP